MLHVVFFLWGTASRLVLPPFCFKGVWVLTTEQLIHSECFLIVSNLVIWMKQANYLILWAWENHLVGANCMLGFSPKMSFFAVLVQEARFLSQLNQLIQIIFAVEWQFSQQSPTIVIKELLTGHGSYFFPLHSKSPLYDRRFTCKEEYRDAR